MPAPRIRTRLSQATANKLLSYSKRTGELVWRVDRGPNCKAGQIAGSAQPDGRRLVMIDGKYWSANRLIWFMVTGELPQGRLAYRDDDPTNLKWSNIIPEAVTLSMNKINIQQRERNRRRRAMIADGLLAEIPK